MKKFLLATCMMLFLSGAQNLFSFSSCFDSGSENWRIEGDASPIRWHQTGGVGGGAYISSTDYGKGIWWYFKTPQTWSGNWSNFSKLCFYLKVSHTDELDLKKSFFVKIIGNNNKSIEYYATYGPNSNWKKFEINLTSSTFNVDVETFKGIISNVKKMLIRGEFSSKIDTGSLDNVKLLKYGESCNTGCNNTTSTNCENSQTSYQNGYNAGIKFCKQNPEKCGISSNSGYNTGYNEGIKYCKNNPQACGISCSQTSSSNVEGYCATYDFINNIFDVPCFKSGGVIYDLKFNVINGNPVQLQLTGATKK